MDLNILKKEIKYKAIRSGKPGGQHVNKTSSKVQLMFDLINSKAFHPAEKERLMEKLQKRMSAGGLLILKIETFKSQHQNKKAAWEALVLLLQKSLELPKKRLKTKPKKSAILKRLQQKKQHGIKKQNRRKDFYE